MLEDERQERMPGGEQDIGFGVSTRFSVNRMLHYLQYQLQGFNAVCMNILRLESFRVGPKRPSNEAPHCLRSHTSMNECSNMRMHFWRTKSCYLEEGNT